MKLLFPILLLLGGCASPVARNSGSNTDARHPFFSDRNEHKIGDFVLALDYRETASNRLQHAGAIIEKGYPKPALAQEKYLVMPEEALNPTTHYLLLDQRHILIYCEYFELDNGYPAKLEILRRTGDTDWTDISDQTLPQWTRTPKSVSFSADRSRLTVTGPSGESQTFSWKSGKLEPQD
ncbi:hypothetical protein JIN84_15620 [Luteolibacter yonseiensis]|uniref:Lipoprotein n=1 Tax=Luteolibacter yonseiensis TaxID=1144680 RepID=A0A934R285_9BACT|nr:hypothetical protein [Luteolibacter yonseiensis]MBK1817053.1 hypothetical protein [Luteolibacter yonseiensis]